MCQCSRESGSSHLSQLLIGFGKKMCCLFHFRESAYSQRPSVRFLREDNIACWTPVAWDGEMQERPLPCAVGKMFTAKLPRWGRILFDVSNNLTVVIAFKFTGITGSNSVRGCFHLASISLIWASCMPVRAVFGPRRETGTSVISRSIWYASCGISFLDGKIWGDQQGSFVAQWFKVCWFAWLHLPPSNTHESLPNQPKGKRNSRGLGERVHLIQVVHVCWYLQYWRISVFNKKKKGAHPPSLHPGAHGVTPCK